MYKHGYKEPKITTRSVRLSHTTLCLFIYISSNSPKIENILYLLPGRMSKAHAQACMEMLFVHLNSGEVPWVPPRRMRLL